MPTTYIEPSEAAVEGSDCNDQGKLTPDANTGKELYCATFSLSRWIWTQTPTNITGLHKTNTSCDPRVEVTSRSPDVYLITCQAPYGATGPAARATWQHFQSMFE
jgi:hypothetical protein